MEFLGVGPLELFLVLLLALALIGPKDIGKHARTVGRTLQRVYRSEEWKTVQQASRNLRSLPNRLAREAEFDELDQLHRTPPASPPAGEDVDFAWRRPTPAPPPTPPDAEPRG
jgi:Sec-independent protein translocase protein TatA